MNILRLNLLAPIHYRLLKGFDPFEYSGENGEMLFCFELDESQRLSFEPDPQTLLGILVFGGIALKDVPDEPKTDLLELPGGNYIFAQKQELLNRDEIIAMALEIQKEGLWQRLKPGERLYLRYLFEDDSVVTQLYRPYTN